MVEKSQSDVDPLVWWQQNEQRFPTIKLVARKVLCVPATSVPSERIFACAGLLINKLRNRLSTDIVDKNQQELNISPQELQKWTVVKKRSPRSDAA